MENNTIIESIAWKTCGIIAFFTMIFSSAIIALLILLIPFNLSMHYSRLRNKEYEFELED